MQGEKLLLTLSAEENKLFESCANEFELEIINAESRSMLLRTAQHETPLIVVLYISTEDGIGGIAVGEAIKQVSPKTIVIFVGEKSDKNSVEALFAGDYFLPQPLTPELVNFMLDTTVMKSRLGRTGKLKHKKQYDTRATEAHAMHRFALKLAGAKRSAQIAEIVKGFISEIINFRVFAFINIEKDQTYNRVRVYCNSANSSHTIEKVKSSIITEVRKISPEQRSSDFIVYGRIDDALASWDEFHYLSWKLEMDSVLGMIVLFNDTPYNISEPLKIIAKAIITQTSAILYRHQELEAERSSLLQTVLGCMNDGVIWIEERKAQTIVNRQAMNFLGIEAKGKENEERLGRDEVFDILRRLNIYDELFGLEARKQKMIVRVINLGDFILQFEVLRITQSGQMNIGSLIVIKDITQERNDAREREDLYQTIANEIKAPLKTIQDYFWHFENEIDPKIVENHKQPLAKIKNSANRISDLVNFFINSNKLSYDSLKKRPIKVEELFQDVSAKYIDEAAKRKIAIKTEVLQGAKTVLADNEQILIVMHNLLNNSLNYTPDSGEIVLRAEPSEFTQIQPPGRKRKSQTFTKLPRFFVEISCSDTGLGIPASDMDVVFERFAQSETPSVTGRKGTGLGLTIAQNIIRAHGGDIWIDRNYTNGTKVVFILPVGFATTK